MKNKTKAELIDILESNIVEIFNLKNQAGRCFGFLKQANKKIKYQNRIIKRDAKGIKEIKNCSESIIKSLMFDIREIEKQQTELALSEKKSRELTSHIEYLIKSHSEQIRDMKRIIHTFVNNTNDEDCLLCQESSKLLGYDFVSNCVYDYFKQKKNY